MIAHMEYRPSRSLAALLRDILALLLSLWRAPKIVSPEDSDAAAIDWEDGESS